MRGGLGAERLAAIDDPAARVLVGEPRGGAVLADAGLRVVADAAGEGRLDLPPLVVGEADRVVVAAQRLELALHDVLRERAVGALAGRAVGRHRLVAQLGWLLVP